MATFISVYDLLFIAAEFSLSKIFVGGNLVSKKDKYQQRQLPSLKSTEGF